MRFLSFAFVFFFLLSHSSRAGDVTLFQDARIFKISNGKLAATIEKSSGKITSVVLAGQELLGGGTGYWSMSASSARNRVGGFGHSKEQIVSIDPNTNSGERAEVICRFHGTGVDGAYPGASEIRYAIDRHSTTLYATAVLGHGAGDASFGIGEGRFVIKLDSGIFDQLTVDKDRNWIMPTSREWDEGTPLNLKEARRITTGIHAGWAEHKYSYSAILEKVPAYGWLGTKQKFGVWMINPSIEYIAGGPTKMELTGHLDVGGDALPTLLNMWHGSHYGGSVLSLAKDEQWSKVLGPFAIHFNEGDSPDRLWSDALERAKIERSAWPYSWGGSETARGAVGGKIRIIDSFSKTSPISGMWVGLTVPDYVLQDRMGSKEVGWQRDGKYYQYWARTAADGTFQLKGVRPGDYVFHAFTDGVLGEFQQAGIVVAADSTLPLGDLVWKPERSGPTLWEIGIPDRSAAEFRNGDRYWHWGNYLKFKEDFPNGVNYVVGKSDWKKDWHICQPLNLSADCEVLGDSVWTVRFPMETIPAGGSRLRISFCGSREGSSLALILNGREVGNTGLLPENGTMHRDSHRGMWFERSFTFPAAALKTGENVLLFKLKGHAWHQGVLRVFRNDRMEAIRGGSN